jgi:hypothetical protein
LRRATIVLRATISSVSPNCARRSPCPISTMVAPSSANSVPLTSPVNGPASSQCRSCAPTVIPAGRASSTTPGMLGKVGMSKNCTVPLGCRRAVGRCRRPPVPSPWCAGGRSTSSGWSRWRTGPSSGAPRVGGRAGALQLVGEGSDDRAKDTAPRVGGADALVPVRAGPAQFRGQLRGLLRGVFGDGGGVLPGLQERAAFFDSCGKGVGETERLRRSGRRAARRPGRDHGLVPDLCLAEAHQRPVGLRDACRHGCGVHRCRRRRRTMRRLLR